jgi:SAM-dependent methyltransferase
MDGSPRTFGWPDADAYWRNRQAGARSGERRIHRFLTSLATSIAPPGGTLLDCGAGEGHVLRLCQPRLRVFACDLSADVLAGYDFPLAGVKCLDLNRAFPDFGVQFDAIVASWLLHWLDDPEGFLAEAAKHLAPGGKLIVNVPNITFLRYRLEFLGGKFPQISLSHRNFQTPTEIEAMIGRGPLRIHRRTSPQSGPHRRWWPKLFSRDIVYVLAPRASMTREAAANSSASVTPCVKSTVPRQAEAA